MENSEAAKQQAVVAKRVAKLATRCQAAEARWTQARQEANMSEERAQRAAALATVVQAECGVQTQAVAEAMHNEARHAHERAAERRKERDQLRAQQRAVAQEAAALTTPPPMFLTHWRRSGLPAAQHTPAWHSSVAVTLPEFFCVSSISAGAH